VSECPHLECGEAFLENGQYCLRCKIRIHIVMEGYSVIRFEPCREGVKLPRKFSEHAKKCNCETVIKLEEGQRLA